MVTLVFPLSHCTLFTFFAAKNLMVDLSSFKVMFFFDLLFSLTVIFFLCLPAFFNAFLTAFLTERLTFEVFLLPVTFTSTTMFVFFFKPFFCCIEVALGAIVGVTVGASLGVIVGVAVGTALGVTVGVAVGVTVGSTLGVSVGVTLGVIVGVTVGVALGVIAGVTVGVALGVIAGVIVGVASG